MKKSKQCKKFSSVQTRVFCFHESHQDGPRELHECTSKSRHESSIFCLMHRSKTEPLPNPLDLSSVAQEYSKNNITKRKFSIDKDFRKKLHSKGREAFSRSGYHSLHIVFTTHEEERLTACMKQIQAQSRLKVEYQTGHFGYIISKTNLDRLLPLDLRRALLTTDLVQSVEFFFGVPGSLTVFALEAHGVGPYAPEQILHADVIPNEKFDEEIKRLAVTCIISIRGAATTMVCPQTAGKLLSLDELSGMECIRATEDKNCVLFDASAAHKGSANQSSEPTLRFAFTFIQTSASEKQRKWVQTCTGIKNPLNMSVAQFLGEKAALSAAAAPAAVPADTAAGGGPMARGLPLSPAASDQACSGQPTPISL